MDFDSVLSWFEGIAINWNPDLLLYRKSYFDHWTIENMLRYDSKVSLKENPQYYIKFCQPEGQQSIAQSGDTIIAWVVISKLLVMHKNGDFEIEENAKDYIAMHVYPNNEKGSKILTASNSLIRSHYSSEQSVMLYLEIKAAEYFNLNKVLNLVLDQLDR